MTDNEIIKALECCSESELKEDCKKLKCPFFDNENCNCMNVDDENAMYRYSLDLINRQKSQILKEQNKNSKLRNERNHLKAEIERLKPLEENFDKILYMLNAVAIGQSVLEEQKHKIKAEAVKEFAEIIVSDYPEMEYYLDELRKELLGENK